ncbi:MAG TPA: hypothetical protein VHP30_09945 [Ignavibacteriales bacterium]|nr:hypothetical protein [Ignavibacteriales bacterium]
MKYLKYAAAVVLAGLSFTGCSGSSEVESSFNNSQIKIDGSQSDWAGSLKTVKDDNMAYGFKNDGQNLYLCLVTSDASKAMRILTMGLTVWLDPGSSKDVIGVKFPLRPERGEMRDFRMQMPDSTGFRDREKRIESLISMQKELTVTNKDDLPLYTSEIASAKDFQAGISYQKDQFVYELKVPLEGNSTAQTVLKARPGEDVEVKIETGKIDMTQRGGGMRMGSGGQGGSRPPMGGGGREGGGSGRRGGGGERGGMRQNFKPLDYTFEVKLAK